MKALLGIVYTLCFISNAVCFELMSWSDFKNALSGALASGKEYAATKLVTGIPYLQDILGDCPVVYNCTALVADFDKNVVGQSVATEFITDTMYTHWNTPVTFRTPLSYHFYGMSGTGKSHVAEILIKNIFKYGTRSPYFVYASGFKFDPTLSWKFMENIHKIVSRCPHSLFLFEDIEQFSSSFWYQLQDIISRPSHLYAHSTFIFTSKLGQNVILDVTHEIFAEGFTRDEYLTTRFTVDKPFVQYMTERLNNDLEFQNAHKKVNILKYIHYHVPFLPMEADVVKECVKRIANSTDENFIKSVLRQVDFTNDVIPVSSHGCKVILPIVLQEKHRMKMKN